MARLSHYRWGLRRFYKRAQPIVISVAKALAIAVLLPIVATAHAFNKTVAFIAATRRLLRYFFVDIPRSILSFGRRAAPLAALLGGTIMLLYLTPPGSKAARPPNNTPPPTLLSSAAATPNLPMRNPRAQQLETRLAAFHGTSHQYANTTLARRVLADVLDIPPITDNHDLEAALQRAESNASSLGRAAGSFPLPHNISTRLLAALTTADVSLLAHHLTSLFDGVAGHSTISGDLYSPGMHFNGDVNLSPRQSLRQRCLSFSLRIARRTFTDNLAGTACRDGDRYLMQSNR